MQNKIVIAAILCGLLFPSFAIAEGMVDNGTGPDGVPVICSKTMAMHCEISSKDAEDQEKFTECLNKIASDAVGNQNAKQDVLETRNRILRECSSHYIDLAVKYKADAGDHKDIGKADGAFDAPADKHGKRTQEGKITAENGQNIVKLTDLYSSLIIVNSMEGFFDYLHWRDVEKDEEGKDKKETTTTESGGGNE